MKRLILLLSLAGACGTEPPGFELDASADGARATFETHTSETPPGVHLLAPFEPADAGPEPTAADAAGPELDAAAPFEPGDAGRGCELNACGACVSPCPLGFESFDSCEPLQPCTPGSQCPEGCSGPFLPGAADVFRCIPDAGGAVACSQCRCEL